ncbi:MAG: pantetheine-phosphate adenylyltransferase [Prevotellaceae bacterium]|jgi:pantetheine-phosphate adenylyltransferase|nr:pantetheine-phosphate adenylyltransferase [Prevotellaceae bacterium]
MATAIFPGSFDPFTVGHADIVKRSAAIFDKVIIGIGINSSKNALYSAEKRLETIQNLYKNEVKIEAKIFEGLSVDFAKKNGAKFIVRAVRSTADFEYERTLAEINRSIYGIETVILFANPALAHISSSIVRELISYGKNVEKFLPKM